MAFVKLCGNCNGRGKTEAGPCTVCEGCGEVLTSKKLTDIVDKCDATLAKCDSTLAKCDSVISQCTNIQTDVDTVEATTDGSSTDIVNVENKVDTVDGKCDTIDAVVTDLETRLNDVEEDMAAEIDVHVWFYDTITQGTFYTIVGPNHWRNRQMYNNPPAADDRINYKVLMKAGTYDFRLVCSKAPAQGTLRMYIDDVEKAAINTYNATVVHNTINVETGIVVAETGVKTVSLKVDGDFQMNVAAIMFHKVA